MTLVHFSPGERYLVTFSSVEPTNPRDTTAIILNIFDVKTGAKLRNFQLTPEDVFLHPGGLATNWPFFKWAGGCDDKCACEPSCHPTLHFLMSWPNHPLMKDSYVLGKVLVRHPHICQSAIANGAKVRGFCLSRPNI